MDNVELMERKPKSATETSVLFSLHNIPLLEQGTTYDPPATAENLWISLKVYASVG